MSMEEWAVKHGDLDYKVLARTEVGSWTVSTVWIGINHNLSGQGPPLIFETMVFRPGDWSGEYCERYATQAQARAGHDRAVAWTADARKRTQFIIVPDDLDGLA